MSTVLDTLASKLVGRSANKGETNSISDMLVAMYNLDGQHGSAITTVSKKTLVGSNVYIEQSLLTEEQLMINLLGTLCQIYVGYVICALEIYQSVDRYRTIRETVARVATEGLHDPVSLVDNIEAAFAHRDGGEKGVPGMESVTTPTKFDNSVEENVSHLAAGRLIEFDFVVNENEDMSGGADGLGDTNANKVRKVTVPIQVQTYPVSMATDVAKAIVQCNYPEDILRRLAKAHSREIRLLNDFVFSMDLIDKHRDAIRQDRTNVLNEFYKGKFSKQARRVYDVLTGNNRNNLATSIVVLDATTFEQIQDEASINLRSFTGRQKFFNESYTMMMVVIDTNYSIIEFYYNGISGKSELPFRAIKQAGSSSSGIDLEELMKTIAQGNAPKF